MNTILTLGLFFAAQIKEKELKFSVQTKFVFGYCGHDTSTLIITNTFFKEIRFACDRNVIHKVKWTITMINLNRRQKSFREQFKCQVFVLPLNNLIQPKDDQQQI